MAEDIPFDRTPPAPGALERLSPLVRRFVIDNPSPFTFTGTCCYVVGQGRVAVIDPGPGRDGEAEALLAALGGEEVAHVIVTHTHRDHSPGARRLKELTGAPIAGCAPHWSARAVAIGEASPLDASADRDHAPDLLMKDGDVLAGEGWRLEAVETPGHTMNHLCFALPEEETLFSGDHVMAWSTSIVAPPDGSMGAYMTSLDRLRLRTERIYRPGHGGPVLDPDRFLRGLVGHRRMREASILSALKDGPSPIPALVKRLYVGLAPALKGAAGLSVLAHLEDLEERGLVRAEGVGLGGVFALA